MELVNATKMNATYTMGMDPSGRESVVVAVKGTFAIPSEDGALAQLADEQVPLVLADEFTGEPGFSATTYECDFAAEKPQCDVLLNGSAYAPPGEMADRVRVELNVGSMSKSFDVVGNRVWEQGVSGPVPSDPKPFKVMPISYDNAFGGMDETSEDPNHHTSYRPNHVGQGYHGRPHDASVFGLELPNTEEPGKRITNPNGTYRPMSFGAIARSWEPRLKYAGTYDDNWTDNVFPFLPEDFDPRFYQAAPEDQQLPHPKSALDVELINLTPQGRKRFRLPKIQLPIEFTDVDFQRSERLALLDTIVIEPDLNRCTIALRASHPLKRNLGEMKDCIVGRMPRGWYRARELDKTYYSSLAEMISTNREDEEVEA